MGLDLIKGIGLGVGLTYFLDPDSGRRRRALVVDQFDHVYRELEDFLSAAPRDLANRASGLSAELGRRLRGEPTPEDSTLVERVRAKLGRLVSHPRAVEVGALNGHVLLRGRVARRELPGLVSAVAAIPGVVDVADELELSVGEEGGAAAEGERRRAGLSAEGVPPGAKLLAALAGGVLLVRVAGRGPVAGLALGTVGLALATRAIERGGLSGGGRSGGASMGPDRARAQDASSGGGWPGGGRGRVEVVGRSGVYPASGPLPPGTAEVRTPGDFVRGQVDDQGRQVEGASGPSRIGDTVVGGESPDSSSPPAGPPPSGAS